MADKPFVTLFLVIKQYIIVFKTVCVPIYKDVSKSNRCLYCIHLIAYIKISI